MGFLWRVVLADDKPFQNGLDFFSDSLPEANATDILPTTEYGDKLELFAFDSEYVNRLRDGDPSTEQHFVAYFQQLLRIKLRARLMPPDRVDDVSQETFIRVIAALRREGGVRQPERLGAFVNTVCNNVVFEKHRSSSKDQPLEDSHFEIADKALNPEGTYASSEMQQLVHNILDEMPRRDRDLLRAIFLEEKDKDEICREFGVDRDYLRVCLHRAKEKFRESYKKDPDQIQKKGVTNKAGKD